MSGEQLGLVGRDVTPAKRERPPILAVTGGRGGILDDVDRATIARLMIERDLAGLIHGGAEGYDVQAAEHVRRALGRPVHAFPYEGGHKLAGGPIRNRKMARKLAERPGSVCLAFPGGRGTRNMIYECERLGVEVIRVVGWDADGWEHGD